MAPFVPDDLVLQILPRLPPQPSCLLRASLACKHWRGLVTDPRFLRQRRAPLLGVFLNNPPVSTIFVPAGDPADRVPGARFQCPPLPWLVRDSRRGRVLLCDASARFVVWDPVTGGQRLVPRPPAVLNCDCVWYGFGAVLLRGGDDDDDVDAAASSGGFRVAVAFVQADGGAAVAAVYASNTGAWGDLVTAQQAAPASRAVPWAQTPGAAFGDSVYWLLDDDRVLSLKLHAGGGSHVLVVLEPTNAWRVQGRNVKLMRTPGGELGLAAVTGNMLRFWTLQEAAGAVSWALRGTVLVDALLPRAWRPRCPKFGEVRSLALALEDRESMPCARIVGVDEDGAVVFLKRMYDIFMLWVEPTPRIMKIYESYFMMHQKFDTVYSFATHSIPKYCPF